MGCAEWPLLGLRWQSEGAVTGVSLPPAVLGGMHKAWGASPSEQPALRMGSQQERTQGCPCSPVQEHNAPSLLVLAASRILHRSVCCWLLTALMLSGRRPWRSRRDDAEPKALAQGCTLLRIASALSCPGVAHGSCGATRGRAACTWGPAHGTVPGSCGGGVGRDLSPQGERLHGLGLRWGLAGDSLIQETSVKEVYV